MTVLDRRAYLFLADHVLDPLYGYSRACHRNPSLYVDDLTKNSSRSERPVSCSAQFRHYALCGRKGQLERQRVAGPDVYLGAHQPKADFVERVMVHLDATLTGSNS